MNSAGLVDLQVNGFAGVDFNDAAITPGALDRALEAMRRTGVTVCLPTVITAPADVLAARLGALDRAVAASRLGPGMVPGFHLEGPFLNPEPGYRGCHPAEAMITPDAALVDRLAAPLARPILLVTLAPERPQGVETVGALAKAGIAVAIGHSAADHATVGWAAAAGASLSTHLGNALPQPQPKFANPLVAQLAEDRLSASFIADGIHIPPHALRVFIRAKGPARSILVSDATAAAAASPGLYGFAGVAIERAADGAVRLPGTATLAGSSLCLDEAVRNIVGWSIASPADALAMASTNPLALIAPALAAHGLTGDAGAVAWSDDLIRLEIIRPASFSVR